MRSAPEIVSCLIRVSVLWLEYSIQGKGGEGMKQNLKQIILGMGILVILAAVLYSCGGGSSYGGGGGGGTAAPGAFNLVSPADGAPNVGTTPTLSWTAEASATGYIVQVDTFGTFTGTLIINKQEGATTYSDTVSSGTLTTGVQYHWQVVATNAYGQSKAGPRTFTP
jgi:hypothetical protein